MKFTFLTSFPFQGYKATLNKNKDNPNPFHSKYFITLRSLMENYDYRLKQFYNFNYSTITNYDAIILVDNRTLGSSAIEDLDNYECSHADTDIFRLIVLWLNIPVIAFPLLHFNKYSPNNFNATFAKIQKMNEVLDKLNLQKSDEVIVLVSYMKVLEDDVREFLNKLEEYYVNRFTK